MLRNKTFMVNFKPDTYIYLVLLLFLLPFKWLLAWLLAIFAHEMSHWLAVIICGGKTCGVSVSIGGAKMNCTLLSKKKQIMAILSGPIGGLLPVLLSRYFPRVALCCCALSIYNLLPLRPLDGGSLLEIVLGDGVTLVALERIFLIIAGTAALYAAVILHLGCLPLLIIAGLWLRNRKRPCNVRPCRVQ